METLIDVHTHLNMLETSPEDSLKQAREAGVGKVITIGTGPEDNAKVLELAKKFAPDVYCTLGMHPHDAKDFDEATEKFILDNLNEPEVVAIGEIGLDFFYNHSSEDVQRSVFRKMIEISIDAKLPIEIHTRDAEKDTIDILSDYKGQVKGLLHCFSGTDDLAMKGLDLGLNLSISGIVTFKKAHELRDIVKKVPLDRLHVETDAPFLAPVPHRGKKNTPAFVKHVAECVADLKNVSLEELIKHTNNNAKQMFDKIVWA